MSNLAAAIEAARRVNARADNGPEFVLRGEVSDTSVADLTRFLDANAGPVTVRVESDGGSAQAGLEAANAVARHGNVRAITAGRASSAATLIVAAAKTAVGTEAASYMIHQAWTIAGGNAADLRSQADALDVVSLGMRTVYEPRLGAEAGSLMEARADTWLSAAEAQTLGLLDEVVPVGDPRATAPGTHTPVLPNSPGNGGGTPPVGVHGAHTRFQAQRRDGWADAQHSILARAGLQTDDTRSGAFRGLPLRELESRVNRGEIRAAGMFGGGTRSDFGSLLSDTANRALSIAWQTTMEVWMRPSQTIEVRDFRATTVASLGGFASLPKVTENQELENLHPKDQGLVLRLATYAGIFELSRESIVNDDLMGFSRTVPELAAAASRAVGDEFYKALHAANWGDGAALFSVARGNDGADATIDSTGFAKARIGLATAKTPSGHTSGAMVQYVLSGHTNLAAVRKVLMSEFEVVAAGGGASEQTIANAERNIIPVENILTDWRFDTGVDDGSQAANTDAWFAIANGGVVDLALEGMTEPMVSDRMEPDRRLGYCWKVVFDRAVGIANPQLIYRGHS